MIREVCEVVIGVKDVKDVPCYEANQSCESTFLNVPRFSFSNKVISCDGNKHEENHDQNLIRESHLKIVRIKVTVFSGYD